MSQRDSGYERKALDRYETPEWATEALLPHLPAMRGCKVWEPAAGSGKMAAVLARRSEVWSSDIHGNDNAFEHDFLRHETLGRHPVEIATAIITNPPYELATEFCEQALRLMQPYGIVAMLLRTDFDHAKSRAHLFRDCPAFAKKLVLMKRIAWFVEANGKPKASPSFNHAWYIWDWKHDGAPTLAYGP